MQAGNTAKVRDGAGLGTSVSRRRFEQSISTQIEEDFASAGLVRRRISQSVAMAGILAFVLVDYFGSADFGPSWLDWKLIALILPALLLPMAMSMRRVHQGQLWQYALIAMFLFGLAAAAAVDIGRSRNSWLHYESLLLVTLYIYLLSALSFWRALLCGLAAWAAFTATQMREGVDGLAGAGVYYLLAANAIGAFCLYYLEQTARARYRDEVRMRLRAMLDSLTGVLNRGAATDHLERIWTHARREGKAIGLMMVDVDRFKDLNDRLGHLAGDAALRHVADVLTDSTRRPLDAVGRYGGDEFLAMWYDPEPAWFEQMLGGLQSRIAAVEGVDAEEAVALSISGGALMLVPRRDQEFSEFIGELDNRLQTAKRRGRRTIDYRNLSAVPATP